MPYRPEPSAGPEGKTDLDNKPCRTARSAGLEANIDNLFGKAVKPLSGYCSYSVGAE